MFAPRKPDALAARKELVVCGIFGFYNYQVPRSRAEIIEVLLTGLRRLEYRGYDSAGLAVDSAPIELSIGGDAAAVNGPSSTPSAAPPLVIKSCGKISELEAQVRRELDARGIDKAVHFDVHAGIAHTRWATHGPPSVVNAHPHISGRDGEFVVVHNGIITNFRALKDFLVHHGEIFESETDTEVIPKLFKWVYNSLAEPVVFSQLVIDVMSQLEGAYALLVKSVHYPGEMVACKRGSPLILGVKKPQSGSPGSPIVAGAPLSNGPRAEDTEPLSMVAKEASAGMKRSAVPSLAVSKRRPGVEYYLASDASAVVEHTKRVIVLEEGDVVALRRGTYEIFNFGESGAAACGARGGDLAPQPRALQTLNLEISSIMKGGYDHFMQKEIFEQPETVLQSMRGRVKFQSDAPAAAVAVAAGSPVAWTQSLGRGDSADRDAGNNGIAVIRANKDSGNNGNPKLRTNAAGSKNPIHVPGLPSNGPTPPHGQHAAPLEERIKLGGLSEHLEAIRTGRRLVLVGCGTSFHACLAARKALEDLVSLPVALELASDLLDRCPPIFRDDTCVFVSQSGETADTLRAMEYAKSKGALCVGITNTVGSDIARSTHCGVHINAGCEIGVASTKAYTSQIVVLVMMALALSGDRISQQAKREEILDALGQLPSALRAALKLDGQVKELAERLKEEQSLLVFGRGYNYATALEAALKVKEVALMHSEGILAGEMKHGPLALVDETMPILVVATADEMHAKMLSVIQQLRARGARLLVLCCEGDEDVRQAAGDEAVLVAVPRTADCLQPVVNAVPLQLLAYHLAVLRGQNVDQPRNLAKSVTVTEELGVGNGGKR